MITVLVVTKKLLCVMINALSCLSLWEGYTSSSPCAPTTVKPLQDNPHTNVMWNIASVHVCHVWRVCLYMLRCVYVYSILECQCLVRPPLWCAPLWKWCVGWMWLHTAGNSPQGETDTLQPPLRSGLRWTPHCSPCNNGHRNVRKGQLEKEIRY